MFSTEVVRNMFFERGCTLLDVEYRGYNLPMKYICSCGNERTTTLRNFRAGKGCVSCGRIKAEITDRIRHGGLRATQTVEFKTKRTRTVQDRYGVSSVSSLQETKNKCEKTCLGRYGSRFYLTSCQGKEKSKISLLERYGVEYPLQIPSAREALKATLLKVYGVPSLAYLSRSASKQSQDLFWRVYRLLPEEHRSHTYFAELNHEFVMTYKGEHYKYDFVVTSLKQALEFNGEKFHPCPEMIDTDIGWCVFHPYLTAGEARYKEMLKREALESRGFVLHTLWSSEFKNKVWAAEKCLNMLMIHQWGQKATA